MPSPSLRPPGGGGSQPSHDGTPQNAPGGPLPIPRSLSTKSMLICVGIIDIALGRVVLSSEEQEAWASLRALTTAGGETRPVPGATTIEREVRELKTEIQSLASTLKKACDGSKPSSWAQIAAPTRLVPPVPARRAREVLISPGLETDPARNSSSAEIVQSVQKAAGGNGGILGARKLPSGAIALTFESTEAKKRWSAQGKVTEIFGLGAEIKEATNDVIAFGAPVGAISGIQPAARVQAISSQNPSFSPILKQVGVLKPKGSKRYEAIILGFSSPQAANSVIDSGILWDLSILNAEPYIREVRLGRCFRCQSYGKHTARFCRNTAICGWCATDGHTLEDCPNRQNLGKKACAPCGGALGHCALDRNCPIRQREEDKARAAYSTRPTHFETPSTSPPTCSQPSEEQQPRPQDTEPDEEGFLRVGCKRRRGKPTRASQANTSGMPSIASFLKVPSTQFSDSSPGSGSFSGSPPSPQQNTSPAREIDNATAKPQSL